MADSLLTYPIVVADASTLSREEWLALRQTGIGGSDAAAILGVSPWTSRYALWADKAATTVKVGKETAAMAFGTRMEPVIREAFAEQTGLRVVTDDNHYRHPQHDFMLANLDGLVLDDFTGEPIAVLEIKTASRASDWQNGVPAYYVSQVQHYMAVTNLPLTYVAVLIAGTDLRTYTVERDQGYIATLIKAEAEFWQSLQSLTEPEVDGHDSTRDALRDAWQPESGKEIELDADFADLIAERAALKAEIDARAERVKALESAIMRVMEDAEVATINGEKVVTWKAQTRTSLDTTKLKKEHPEIAEQYAKTSSFRVLKVGS
jgi:putative phage-type endonuclease